MEGSISVKESSKVSPFFAFFIISSTQIGVGVLGFQKYIVQGMGYDAWMAVILAGLAIHLYIWLIYSIMNRTQMDIIYLNRALLGKWLGNFINAILIAYLLLLSLTVLRSYIEIVQVWMFKNLNTWVISFFILFLVAYVIKGGFRSVAGICFLGVAIPSFLLITIYFPLQYAHFGNLLPIGNFTIKELGISTRNMVLSYLGFEMIFFFYPFIKEGKKSQKWAQLGHLSSVLTYLIIGIISFAYFSEPYLRKTEWTTLTLWKVVEFPFLARFEYIGVTTWFIVIVPILCLWLWAASRSVKHIFPKLQQKSVLFVVLALLFISVSFFQTREEISMLNTFSSRFGFYFFGGYVPFMYFMTLFKKVDKI
ncbi:GerAB/ArcD/ProY family transporter [Halobacillus massiliensis]|uniref:GerAB/ArcD/ProY family transporter n=1 Tax=Halobacillus massiliensis TaxID=1926286 RepID=UPI0009E4F98F|nr:GerAB/ArcD/ProY family transporter [Halobacillus massiliensis]